MLVPKEIIGPGTVWYKDLKSGEPRKAVVTAEHIKHWCDQGNEMLAAGLTVPVPCEHDFQAHPMTPADKLKNNAGWVQKYEVKDGKLLSVLDIQDKELAEKLPTTVRWTSPWFASFIDGTGKEWKNVIAHLALTTRPRVLDQAPFPSIAAALEAAVEEEFPGEVTLCQAGMLDGDKPLYPVAFSLYSGAVLSDEDMKKEDDEEEKSKKKEPDVNPLASAKSEDMEMETLLSDLLSILGVAMPATVGKADFKQALYKAAMLKIKELSTSTKPPPVPQPGNPSPANKSRNPIVQEQQPMYMNLEEINKIPDETMRNIALSMYNENVKLRGELELNSKATASLRDAKLAEENAKRRLRVERLGRILPSVKADLAAMEALPAMALSLGDSGIVTDPMGQTIALMEKGIPDVPRLLMTLATEVPHPTDAAMSVEEEDALAATQARAMGCPTETKSA